MIRLLALLVLLVSSPALAQGITAGNVMGAEVIELAGGDAHIGWVGILAGILTVLGVLLAVLIRPKP